MKTNNLICIFCYNVSNDIEFIFKKITKYKLLKHKILFINDKSKDDTLLKIKKFKLKYNKNNIYIINNKINKGYGGNYKIAINFCKRGKFDKLIFLHGDNQYPANKVSHVIKELNNCDLSFGSRMANKKSSFKNMPLIKYFVNKLLTFFINFLFNSKNSEYFSGFRGLKVDKLLNLNLNQFVDGYEIEQQIHYVFIKKKYKISEFPIPTVYDGQISRIPPVRYVVSTVLIAINYSLFKNL